DQLAPDVRSDLVEDGRVVCPGHGDEHDICSLGRIRVASAARRRATRYRCRQPFCGDHCLVGGARADHDCIAGARQAERQACTQRTGAADDCDRCFAHLHAPVRSYSFMSVSGTTEMSAASSAWRIPRPTMTPVASSPWTHSVCTLTLMRLPLRATISPSRTIRTACSPACFGSLSTVPGIAREARLPSSA